MKRRVLFMLTAAIMMPFMMQAQSKSAHYVITDTTVCDSYTWPVNGVTYDSSTAATHYNAAGDTLYILDLTVNPSVTNTVSTPIHGGCTYTWNGRTYTISGTYTDTMSTVAQCDSIVTLTVLLSDTAFKTYTVTNCGPYEWQGSTYSTSTNVTRAIHSSHCDSVLTLELTVLEPVAIEHYDTVTACNQLFYRFAAGMPLVTIKNTSDTTRLFSSRTVEQCYDSNAHTHFQINKSDYIDRTVNACDSYTLVIDSTHSNTYNYDILDTVRVGRNINSCDSFVVLNLTVKPSPRPVIGGDINVRPGESATLVVTCDQQGVTFRWHNGSTADNITLNNVMQNQDVSVVATNPSTTCQGETHVTVTANEGIESASKTNVSIYPNPTSSTVSINANEMMENVAIYNMAGQRVAYSDKASSSATFDLSSLMNGSYMVNITLASGKQTTRKIVVSH